MARIVIKRIREFQTRNEHSLGDVSTRPTRCETMRLKTGRSVSGRAASTNSRSSSGTSLSSIASDRLSSRCCTASAAAVRIAKCIWPSPLAASSGSQELSFILESRSLADLPPPKYSPVANVPDRPRAGLYHLILRCNIHRGLIIRPKVLRYCYCDQRLSRDEWRTRISSDLIAVHRAMGPIGHSQSGKCRAKKAEWAIL